MRIDTQTSLFAPRIGSIDPGAACAAVGAAGKQHLSLVRAASILLFALCCLLGASRTHAQGGAPGYPESIMSYDPREVAMLPNYCIYTQPFRTKIAEGNDPDKVQYWKTVMGPTLTGKPQYLFETIHHYCWGLMKTNRATKLVRTKQHRTMYLNTSLSEFDYVINHAPPDFALLPEIHTRKGENLLRLGKAAEAMKDLERAMALKPDYWPPYLALSKYYTGINERDKARAVLERGLSAAPNAKALQAQLQELNARN